MRVTILFLLVTIHTSHVSHSNDGKNEYLGHKVVKLIIPTPSALPYLQDQHCLTVTSLIVI